MNITLRTPGMPRIATDWLRPESFLGREFFDFSNDYITPRLGITVPSVNIRESEKEFVFEVAAPGLERKDFVLELTNNVLKIAVEKEEKMEEKEKEYYRKEYSFQSFERLFTLPENIKEAEIDAKYENGILRVLVPKMEKTAVRQAKKIVVA